MTKLYVGNLPYSFNDAALHDLFAAYGEVATANIVIDKMNGRSKGFGFVELADDEMAQKAILEMNNKPIESRNIVVSVARPKEDRPRRDFGGSNGGSNGGRRSFR